MATNLAIDPELLERALKVGALPTKKETVSIALEEFIARRERMKIVDLFGTIDFDPDYEPKADRQSRDGKLGLTG